MAREFLGACEEVAEEVSGHFGLNVVVPGEHRGHELGVERLAVPPPFVRVVLEDEYPVQVRPTQRLISIIGATREKNDQGSTYNLTITDSGLSE